MVSVSGQVAVLQTKSKLGFSIPFNSLGHTGTLKMQTIIWADHRPDLRQQMGTTSNWGGTPAIVWYLVQVRTLGLKNVDTTLNA